MFQIPEPGASKPENRFPFKDQKGKEFSLPKIEFLPSAASKYMEGVTSGTVTDPGYTAFLREFMSLAEPKVKAAVADLSRDQLVSLRNAWYEASKETIEVGESSASESS